MGQKVHPRSLRLGIIETWQSRWFADRDFAGNLKEDMEIRKYIKDNLKSAGIARIEIERAASVVKVRIFSAKPGLLIGKKGKEHDELRKKLRSIVRREVKVDIVEARKADMDAQLVAENIAFQLERRVNFRRAMKESVSRALRVGAEGVRVTVGGRLNGAEIARTERYREGRVPLHTIRADIDYGTARAETAYGTIGIKVWIFKGEKFQPGEQVPVEAMQL